MSGLQYPIGSFISWCDEYYKVIENISDYSGVVMDMAGDKAKFYFEYGGEKAVRIDDKDKIKELRRHLSSVAF
jgi:hypothetical protein